LNFENYTFKKSILFTVFTSHPLYLCHRTSPYKLGIPCYTIGHLSFMYDIHRNSSISQASSSAVDEAVWTYTI